MLIAIKKSNLHTNVIADMVKYDKFNDNEANENVIEKSKDLNSKVDIVVSSSSNVNAAFINVPNIEDGVVSTTTEKSICRNSGMLAIENSGPYATDIVATLPEGNMENTASITTIDDIIARKIENMRNKKISTPKIIP